LTPDQAAASLAEIGYLLRRKEDYHRARAFSKVAATLLETQPDLARLRRSDGLEKIEGVGSGIAKVLAELVDTGSSSYVEKLRSELGEVVPSPGPSPSASPVTREGYRGDLHTHTDWSDGSATVLEMAAGALARGYEYLAITDHSPRLQIVNGLGPERLAAQARLIAEANQRLEGLTVLQGIEVDILEDGSLDLPDETLAGLDVVIASPHLKLKMEPAAMTERMLKAVEHPHVDVIGHPTGRRPGSRPGAQYDFELVFKRAAERGIALEIDCDPARMDLSPEMARMAADLGCRLVVDSDAHAVDQFVYVDLGLWTLSRAGLDPAKVLNWLPLAEVRKTFA
jgi:putative hydrolase